MTLLRLDAYEARLLGVLIEKAATTPDAYPLTLHALRLAANQKSNRDPEVDWSEAEVLLGLEGLIGKDLAERVSGARAEKFCHSTAARLGLDAAQLAVLAELLLRGPQAPGELRARASRMHELPTLYELNQVLGALEQQGLAKRLPPVPGTRTERWRERLTWGTEAPDAPHAAPPRTPEEVLERHDARAAERRRSEPAGEPAARAGAAEDEALGARIERLERRVERLEALLAELDPEAADSP